TYYVLAGTAPVLVHNCGANTDGYLYRGLAKGHRSYDTASEGRAVPVGGKSGIKEHVGADDTDSPFTSWSDDPEVAKFGAENLGKKYVGEGVMLRIKVDNIDPAIGPSRNIQIHDTDHEWGGFDEDEHLIVGEILADEISLDLGKTWTKIARG
ncbi:hypothetical protein AB1388_35440, partial [Streptomyces hydrogenans]|uniref:hypothetical protein n=1 Tax=Streptomyces hydrogenans TaxID=1873719 RepID=UPI00345D516C